MPLHALATHGAIDPSQITISSSAEDYVLLDEYTWIPTANPVVLKVVIQSGVVLSASATSEYALSFAGLHADSLVMLTNLGVVQGAGGTGGKGGELLHVFDDGFGTSYWTFFYSGGGGGGAGKVVGPGGAILNSPVEETETVGVDGTSGSYPGTPAVGGAGGTSYLDQGSGAGPTSSLSYTVGESAANGGTAMFTPCDMDITNGSGYILGGGGGGSPGHADQSGNPFRPDLATIYLPADGGDPGDDGDEAKSGDGLNGSAGYAIKYTGNLPTWVSGETSPNVEGDISA